MKSDINCVLGNIYISGWIWQYKYDLGKIVNFAGWFLICFYHYDNATNPHTIDKVILNFFPDPLDPPPRGHVTARDFLGRPTSDDANISCGRLDADPTGYRSTIKISEWRAKTIDIQHLSRAEYFMQPKWRRGSHIFPFAVSASTNSICVMPNLKPCNVLCRRLDINLEIYIFSPQYVTQEELCYVFMNVWITALQ